MKALILNSGLGSRMGVLTSEHPKCMTEVSSRETILSRQLKHIAEAGIEEVVMTTGYYDGVLVNYCESLDLPLHFTFVKNPIYDQTNYIYSIYCAKDYLDDDIILMHGDLVFETEVFDRVVASEVSCMTVSTHSSRGQGKIAYCFPSTSLKPNCGWVCLYSPNFVPCCVRP